MTQQPTLKSRHLYLRPFALTDAVDVQSMAGDIRISKMTENIPYPYSVNMASQWISTHQANWNTRKKVTWAACSSLDNKLIGCVSLVINTENRRASLGYWIGNAYWGNGFCTEAATEAVEFGFNHLNLQRIEATHLTVNPASGAVMRKVGMTHEGTMRKYVLKNGVFEDMELYAILAE